MQENNLDPDDRAKTGCVGILLPLAGVVYGLAIILRREGIGNRGIRSLRGEDAVGFGISAIGMALFVHACGFVPYRRHPVIRAALLLAGIGLFFKGLLW